MSVPDSSSTLPSQPTSACNADVDPFSDSSLLQLVQELQEREADLKAELSAVAEAYATLRNEAEAHDQDSASLQQRIASLTQENERLKKQLADLKMQTFREVKAAEADKMKMRLEKVEHAVEQERLKCARLESQLEEAQRISPQAAEALQQMPHIKAELESLHQLLSESEAALSSERLTSSSMKDHLTQLIQAGHHQLEDAAKADAQLKQLKQENASLRAEVHRLREVEAAMHLRVRAVEDRFHAADSVACDITSQNKSLLASSDKLVRVNNDLVEQVNAQATTIVALRTQLEAAQRLVEAMAVEPPQPISSVPSEITTDAENGGQVPRVGQTSSSPPPSHSKKVSALAQQVDRLESELHKQRDMNVVLRTQLLRAGVSSAITEVETPKHRKHYSLWQYISGDDKVKDMVLGA